MDLGAAIYPARYHVLTVERLSVRRLGPPARENHA